MKKNVYLFEINDVIANQMKLPYSTGLIWSYCLEAQAVKDNYQLAEWLTWEEMIADCYDYLLPIIKWAEQKVTNAT